MAPAHDDRESDYSAGLIDLSDRALFTSASEEEQSPEMRSSSVVQALHQGTEEFDDPQPEPLRSGRDVTGTLQNERQFKYGGPSNAREEWSSNVPAILPFQETPQLAHWESFKIDFDLSESGKKQKAKGKVVETNVSLDHPALRQYKEIALYDSGSRFKLPRPTKEIEDQIEELGSVDALAKVVEDFNRSDVTEDLPKDYAPRIFLEPLTVQKQQGIGQKRQVSPSAIRHAVSMTPTRTSKAKNPSTHPSSTGEAAMKIILDTSGLPSEEPLPEELLRSTPQTRENHPIHTDEILHRAKEEARLAEKMASAARVKPLKAVSEARRIQKQADRGKLPTEDRASSPVARKIDRERAISMEKSPRRQSGISTAPQSPQNTPTKATNQPKVVISQHQHSSSHNSLMPATDKALRRAKPAAARTDKRIRKPPIKRKQSIGDGAYTPDTKRPKTTPLSSLEKGNESKPQTPKQTVHFDSDNDSGMNILDQATIIITPEKRKDVIKKAAKPTTTATPESKKRPRSSVARTPETKKKVSKAESGGKAAGESASKAKSRKEVEEDVEENVDEDEDELRTEVQKNGTRVHFIRSPASPVATRSPRGIPSGYISLIEQRLLQTEIVVLELLSAIYKSQTSIDLQPLPETGRRLLANYAQKQAKSHKIEEWQSLPLNTENQRHIWWSKKSDLIAKTAEAHGSRSTQESPAATSPWGMDSPEILLHESMQPPCAGSSTLSPLGHSDVAQAGWRPIAGGTSIPEPTAGLDHLDQSMPGNPTVDYIAGEGIHAPALLFPMLLHPQPPLFSPLALNPPKYIATSFALPPARSNATSIGSSVMAEVYGASSKRRALHDEADDATTESDANGARKRRAFLQTMGQQLREFGTEGISPQDQNRNTFGTSPADNLRPPSSAGNAAVSHASIRPIDTPESDAAPGEDDQLPAGATKSASRWLWKPDEVLPQTPETGAPPIVFDDLLEWSQSYFDHWHPAFPFLHAPSLLDYFRQVVQRGIRVAALSAADELQYIILRSIMSMSVSDRRQMDTSSKPVPACLVFHSINEAIRSTQLVLTEETSILSLQALTSIQLFLITMHRYNAASRLEGLAVRMAFQLGLNRCTPLGIRSDEVSVCYPHTERHQDSEHQRHGDTRDDRLDLLDYLARHANIRGSIMQTRHKSALHGSVNEVDEALEVEAEHTRWWNMVDEHLSNDEQTQTISKTHQVTLIVLRFESILALHRSMLATTKKNAAYNAALQRCISASRSIINTLHRALRGFGAFDGSPGQHGYERTPLLWPSFTWAVWMSAFIILSAATEGQVTREIALRLSDRSIQIMRHLALRGTSWPDACIVAIQNLTTRLHKPSTRSSTVAPDAISQTEARPASESSTALASHRAARPRNEIFSRQHHSSTHAMQHHPEITIMAQPAPLSRHISHPDSASGAATLINNADTLHFQNSGHGEAIAAGNPAYDYLAGAGNFLGIAHQYSDNPLPNEEIVHLFNSGDMEYWLGGDIDTVGNMAYHGFR
ncbi:hypothetical protein DDE82_000900 [Stemphylium lycopersici]|nr:hypothetical protein DDE82_000900 [Stemphylium lycopersici]